MNAYIAMVETNNQPPFEVVRSAILDSLPADVAARTKIDYQDSDNGYRFIIYGDSADAKVIMTTVERALADKQVTQQLDPQYLAAAEALAARPYGVLVEVEANSTGKPIYIARIPELPGCMGQGITEQEAVADVKSAAVVYIQSLLEDGLEVPEPKGNA